MYHAILDTNAPKATAEQLKAYAQEVGLDVPAFEQCRTSGKYQAVVQGDIEEGACTGVTGTPACSINGRMLSGTQPLERFVQIIAEELARAR